MLSCRLSIVEVTDSLLVCLHRRRFIAGQNFWYEQAYHKQLPWYGAGFQALWQEPLIWRGWT